MPHQCVRCNEFYKDGADELLNGCSCGGKMFFYIRKQKLEDAKKEVENLNLTKEDKQQIEKDVYEMVGSNVDLEKPVVLDLESIKILKPGQYELDLVQLFNNNPLIFKLDEGKYMIDIVETFKTIKIKWH